MAIAISTIGVKVSYAFETTAGTRPTSGYKIIPQIKSTPSFNAQPETIETTSFDNLTNKTYINGLKDLGGAMEFTANFTQELYNMWNNSTSGVIKQYNTAKASGKGMWIAVDIPGLSDSAFLPVEPTELGMPELSVNSVAEVSVFFTPVGDTVWAEDPTYATSQA